MYSLFLKNNIDSVKIALIKEAHIVLGSDPSGFGQKRRDLVPVPGKSISANRGLNLANRG